MASLRIEPEVDDDQYDAVIRHETDIAIHQALGFHADVAKSIVFIDSDNILFPISNHVCKMDIDKREQRFYVPKEIVGRVTSVAAYPSREMLAICEAQVAAHPARVTVLNSATGAIIGTFNPPSNRNIISSSFSPSGKVFAVQCAAPSHVLTFLKVDTRAPIASRHMELHINHISFNPVDDAMLCIAGKNCLKLARRQGKEIHVLPLLRPQYECVYSFTESIWLNSDILAAITTTGQVLLIEEGVLRQVLECCPASMIGLNTVAPALQYSQQILTVGTADGNLLVFRGELDPVKRKAEKRRLAGSQAASPRRDSDAEQSQDESESDDEQPDDAANRETLFTLQRKIDTGVRTRFVTLAKAPARDLLLAVTDKGSVLKVPLTAVTEIGGDDAADDEIELLVDELIPFGFHDGSIQLLDVCPQRDLCLTAGADKTVRVWSLSQNRCLAVSSIFDTTPTCLSFHPLGFQALATINNRLYLVHLMRSQLRISHEMSLWTTAESRAEPADQHPVSLLSYSNAGAMFCYACGPKVRWHDAVSLSCQGELDFGVDASIVQLAWSSQDHVLLVVTKSGTVCVYSFADREKKLEYAVRNVRQVAAAVSWLPDQQYVVTFGSDRIMRQVSYTGSGASIPPLPAASPTNLPLPTLISPQQTDSKFTFSPTSSTVEPPAATVTADSKRIVSGISAKVTLSSQAQLSLEVECKQIVESMTIDIVRQLLLATTRAGSLLAFSLPLNPKESPCLPVGKFPLHDGPIHALHLHPHGDGRLISAGRDGAIVSCSLERNGHVLHGQLPRKQSEVPQFSALQRRYNGDEEICLVVLNDVEHVESCVLQLERQIQLNKGGSDESLSMLRLYYESKLAAAAKAAREAAAQHQGELMQQQQKAEKARAELRVALEADTQNVRNELKLTIAKFEERLAVEYDRYEDLQLSSAKVLAQTKEASEIAAQEQADNLARIKAESTRQINEFRSQLGSKEAELAEKVRTYEAMLTDADMESEQQLEAVTDKQKKRAEEESTTTSKAIATMAAAVAQFEDAQSTIGELKQKLYEQDQEKIKLIAQIELLQKDLLRAKSYVRERDSELAERQRELADTVHAATEKEKFRHILNARIEQLEQREAPALEYMTDLQSYIANVESKNSELFNELRVASQNQQAATEKLESVQRQLRDQVQAAVSQKLLVDGVMDEIATLAEATPAEKLPHECARLYHKYARSGLIVQNKSSNKLIPTVEEDEHDRVVRDLLRQREYLTRKVQLTEKEVKKMEMSNRQLRVTAIENSNMLTEEVNSLRQENRKLADELTETKALMLSQHAEMRVRERQRLESTGSRRGSHSGPLAALSHQSSALNVTRSQQKLLEHMVRPVTPQSRPLSAKPKESPFAVDLTRLQADMDSVLNLVETELMDGHAESSTAAQPAARPGSSRADGSLARAQSSAVLSSHVQQPTLGMSASVPVLSQSNLDAMLEPAASVRQEPVKSRAPIRTLPTIVKTAAPLPVSGLPGTPIQQLSLMGGSSLHLDAAPATHGASESDDVIIPDASVEAALKSRQRLAIRIAHGSTSDAKRDTASPEPRPDVSTAAVAPAPVSPTVNSALNAFLHGSMGPHSPQNLLASLHYPVMGRIGNTTMPLPASANAPTPSPVPAAQAVAPVSTPLQQSQAMGRLASAATLGSTLPLVVGNGAFAVSAAGNFTRTAQPMSRIQAGKVGAGALPITNNPPTLAPRPLYKGKPEGTR